MPKRSSGVDPIRLFGDYMKVTGVPSLAFDRSPDPKLQGKTLGVVNGSSWVSLWSTYFGKQFLPGVKIVNAGNEGIQLNFMRAHRAGEPCPPTVNIDKFCDYARDLFDLVRADAVLISCSTMNRAFTRVAEALRPLGVPVVQIDEAMMEMAVNTNGKILIIATHGPTVKSTRALLGETADRLGKRVRFTGATVEDAFEQLGRGDIVAHNASIARTIRQVQKKERIDAVVLAQLSMTVFLFSYPNAVDEFGIPVLTSGETGFKRAGEVLRR